jgi:hypothetical protein
MVRRKLVLVASCIVSARLAAAPDSADAAPLMEREYQNCFLAEWPAGEVRLHDLRLPLPRSRLQGRIVEPSRTRLSAALAERLAPLVARIETMSEARPAPRSRDGSTPVILLRVASRGRWIEDAGGRGGEMLFELVSVRIESAEIMPPGWVAAWEDLASSLNEVVDASLKAPSDEKRQALAAAIEKGSRARDRMETVSSSLGAAEAARAVAKIEPDARIADTFKKDVAREWGDVLRRYAARLKIEPATPLPPGEKGVESSPDRASAELVPWGVAVEEAAPETIAEKLVLRGITVARELPGGSKVGLLPGDLILDYTGLADVGAENQHLRTIDVLGQRAGSGGTAGALDVIRGDALVAVRSENPVEERRFERCYLHEIDGVVWTGEVHIYLGMFGSMAFPPRFRLGAEAARTLAPLVTKAREESNDPLRTWWPPAEGPIVFLRLDGKVRLVAMDWVSHQRTYEIISARIVSAEFVTPEGVRAFEALDRALRDVVEASRAAPGAEKRERLAGAISRGAEAFESLGRARETENMRAAVGRIEPRARIVHELTRRLRGEWGGWLRTCVGALGIEQPGPLRAEPETCPALEILVDSATAAECIAKLRERCGEDALDESLFFSRSLNRMVIPWEIEDLGSESFATIRDEARHAIEDQKKWRAERETAASKAEQDVSEWGVRLRMATAEERAKALVIRGIIVADVRGLGFLLGLKPGDLIVDYGGIHDIVMGGLELQSLRRWTQVLGAGGRFAVIRGGRLVTIEVPKK